MPKAATYRVVSNPVSLAPDELTVLFAGDSQTAPGHRVGPKIVDYYLLHHVLSGTGVFGSPDFGEREIGAGRSFLIYPGQLVRYVSDGADPWRYRWIAFAGSRAAALAEEAGFRPGMPVVDTGAGRTPADRCRSIFEAFRGRSATASLEATGHLYLLLAALREAALVANPAPELRPESHAEELARQVASYMSAQYAEPITIEDMAVTLGYNRAYLSRVFKSRTGLTPATFLTKLRVDHGRRLLRERPELTVEQIALSVGFRDPLYFSKQFRRWYDRTPTEYRAAATKGGR